MAQSLVTAETRSLSGPEQSCDSEERAKGERGPASACQNVINKAWIKNHNGLHRLTRIADFQVLSGKDTGLSMIAEPPDSFERGEQKVLV